MRCHGGRWEVELQGLVVVEVHLAGDGSSRQG